MSYGVYEVENIDEFAEKINLVKVITGCKTIEDAEKHITRYFLKNTDSGVILTIIPELSFYSLPESKKEYHSEIMSEFENENEENNFIDDKIEPDFLSSDETDEIPF